MDYLAHKPKLWHYDTKDCTVRYQSEYMSCVSIWLALTSIDFYKSRVFVTIIAMGVGFSILNTGCNL